MPPRVIAGLEELQSLVGLRLGTSDWFDVTQARIDAFADVTGDRQWIHTDPERAARESPYGTTIAHGFLTLSLAGGLVQQVFRIDGVLTIINYGLNRVRFPTPVRVGSRVRMQADLLGLSEAARGMQAVVKATLEIEGESRPACVAEMVFRLFF